MHCDRSEVIAGSSSRAFKELISDGAEFDFNMTDIARFRDEFKTLIENLSRLYIKTKSAEKHAIFEEKMKRQVAASMGKSTGDLENVTTETIVVHQLQSLETADEESPVEIVPGVATSSAVVSSNEKENRNDQVVDQDSMRIDEWFNSQSSDEMGVERSSEHAAQHSYAHHREDSELV
jgi:hypothetical protein